MSERQLVISARQAELCEEAALRLMREGGRDTDAMHLMTIKHAFMFSRDMQPALPDNVRRLEPALTHSARA